MAKSDPAIRLARADEHHGIARLWMESWVSTGLDIASASLLDKLRARIPVEIENGWSLFVAEDRGSLAAMLALHLLKKISTSCSLRRNIRAIRSAGVCLPSRERNCRTKSGCAVRVKMRKPGASGPILTFASLLSGHFCEC